MSLSHVSITSPLGQLHAYASRTGLRALLFDGAATAAAKHGLDGDVVEDPDCDLLRTLARQLREYFARERRTFELPIDAHGTDFQQRAWQALRQIPFGETRSYADQARAIGNPKAVRAIGLANSRNPLAIVVPCHRVVGANGSLTGYAGGLDRKRALLDHERGLS